MTNEHYSACGQTTILAGDDVENTLSVTDAAIKQITQILKDEDDVTFFRVGVSGGGCSGFQYLFALDDKIYDDDIVVLDTSVKVVTDEVSMPFIKGSEVDYKTTLQASMFVVNNPHVKSQCGCGSSFGV